jgi:hypothetical protein
LNAIFAPVVARVVSLSSTIGALNEKPPVPLAVALPPIPEPPASTVRLASVAPPNVRLRAVFTTTFSG